MKDGQTHWYLYTSWKVGIPKYSTHAWINAHLITSTDCTFIYDVCMSIDRHVNQILFNDLPARQKYRLLFSFLTRERLVMYILFAYLIKNANDILSIRRLCFQSNDRRFVKYLFSRSVHTSEFACNVYSLAYLLRISAFWSISSADT